MKPNSFRTAQLPFNYQKSPKKPMPQFWRTLSTGSAGPSSKNISMLSGPIAPSTMQCSMPLLERIRSSTPSSAFWIRVAPGISLQTDGGHRDYPDSLQSSLIHHRHLFIYAAHPYSKRG